MAKLKLSSLLADMRGRLGSVVISSNGAGGYLKPFRAPTQPRTQRQTDQRARFSQLTWTWGQLSPENRALWTTYALRPDTVRYDWFGDAYYPNARAQFVSLNMARLLAGQDVTEAPPTSDLPAALPAMMAGIDPGGTVFSSYIDFDDSPDESILWLHAAVSLVSSDGRNTPILPFRFVGIHAVSDTWPWDIQSLIAALAGPMPNTGTWYLELTGLSEDFRPGPISHLSALMGQEYP